VDPPSPYVSPGNLTINGLCEANATVNLTGGSTQSTTCSTSGTFSFTVAQSVDGTYSFSSTQTDLAGNISGATTFSWNRNSASVAPPSITSPVVSPLTNNASTYSLVGTCASGASLILSGTGITSADILSPAGNLTQTCPTSGSFSYQIGKSADGTYALSLVQRVGGVNSSAVTRTWVRDTVVPAVTLSSKPAATNLSMSAVFVFSSNKAGSTFQCKLDAGNYAACSSPLTYTSLSSGAHTFYVKTVDSSGNQGAAVSWTWNQNGYNTIALYHFNGTTASNKWKDSSTFTTSGSYSNNLTATPVVTPTASPAPNNFWDDKTLQTLTVAGSSPATTDRSAAGFPTGVNGKLEVATNASLELGRDAMTIEGWFKLSSNIGQGSVMNLVSKTGSGSNLSWEWRLTQTSNGSSCNASAKAKLQFAVSGNGTSYAVYETSNTINYCGTIMYLAVTWSGGTVKFYSMPSTGTTINALPAVLVSGTAVTSLSNTTEPLRIGPSSVSNKKPTSVDELRISQIVRNIATTTNASSVKTNEFSPD
jgi:hypothetical protein